MRYVVVTVLVLLSLASTAQAAEDFHASALSACKSAVAKDAGFRAMNAALGKNVSGPYCECTTDKAQSLNDSEKKELLGNGKPSAGLQQKLNTHAEECINEVVPE